MNHKVKTLQQFDDCESCPVRKLSVFSGLDDSELECLEFNHYVKIFSKGQTIFTEGVLPSGIHVITKGKVKVYKLGLHGKEQIVRLAGIGDILGYRSSISGDKYSASAKALEYCSTCFISRETLFRLIAEDSTLPLRIMELYSKDLKSAEDRLTSLAQYSVRERLAQALLMMNESYGMKSNTQILDIKLTREEISNIIGTATETVIRLLSDLKKDGIIDLVKKEIHILDHEALVFEAKIQD